MNDSTEPSAIANPSTDYRRWVALTVGLIIAACAVIIVVVFRWTDRKGFFNDSSLERVVEGYLAVERERAIHRESLTHPGRPLRLSPNAGS